MRGLPLYRLNSTGNSRGVTNTFTDCTAWFWRDSGVIWSHAKEENSSVGQNGF